MINGIIHATFLVADLNKARTFYEDVLGLKHDDKRPAMRFEGIWYNVAIDQQIHLMLLPNPEVGLQRPTHGGRDRHVALAVSALDKLMAKLEQAEITYTLSSTGRRALFCRDPDGNALEFIEMAAS